MASHVLIVSAMDPFSLCANIITVLQAAHDVISICYDFRAALKHSPWALSRVLDEVGDLRTVLEGLERTVRKENTDASESHNRNLVLLCNSATSPLIFCHRELAHIQRLLDPPRLAGRSGTRRHALIQALGWRLKDHDAQASLSRIERCKSTLNIALTADATSLLLDIQKLAVSFDKKADVLHSDFDQLIHAMSAKHLDQRCSSILEWLCPNDPSGQHDSALRVRQDGTGDWFLTTKAFESWLLGTKNSALWLTGFPGCGKTILFSSILSNVHEKLGQSPLVLIAYFYCDFRSKELRDPGNVAGSLVAQLCLQSGYFSADLEAAYDRNNAAGQKVKPTLNLLKNVISQFCSDHQLILLVDGVDECDRPSDLAEFLGELSHASSDIRILVTSRDRPEIGEHLIDYQRMKIEDNLAQIDNDIQLYAKARLQSDSRLSRLNATIKTEISHGLQEKSRGMFRWTKCQLDSISALHTVKAIRTALDVLPTGLDETYSRILSSIAPQDAVYVRKMLLWLAFSVLPLSLDELHEMLAVEENAYTVDENCRLSDPHDLLLLCGTLVSISSDERLSLAHLSVRDYLMSLDARDRGINSFYALTADAANFELASTCLTYLGFSALAGGPSSSAEAYGQRLQHLPLLKHAATAWPYYVRACAQSEILDDRVADFFATGNRATFMSWVQVLNGDFLFKWDLYPRHATSLYYASSFGMERIVTKLIKDGADLDAPGSRFGGTALHGATLRQHLSVMKLLLEAGADPDKADFNRVTPLHTAAVGASQAIIEILLNHGARHNLKDEGGQTAVDWAVASGHRTLLGLIEAVPTGAREAKAQDLNSPTQPLPVWVRKEVYYPSWYDKRSGMDSSLVISVEFSKHPLNPDHNLTGESRSFLPSTFDRPPFRSALVSQQASCTP